VGWNALQAQWLSPPNGSQEVTGLRLFSEEGVSVRVSGTVESIMPEQTPSWAGTEHREAVRLSWKSRHIPVGTLLMLGLLLACVLSAIFMMIA
jgi:hypothetical protein